MGRSPRRKTTRKRAPRPLPLRLREAEQWLIQRFPLRRSHTVQVRRLRAAAGFHQEVDGVSMIMICAGDPAYAQVDALLHEWAHARERGTSKRREKPHCKRWGREFWPIYSAWHDRD